MRLQKIRLIVILSLTFFSSCKNRDNEIIRLLTSENKEDLIYGAYLAGETGDKKFVTFLLKDANDMRMSTNLRFKGFTVYQEKMIALQKIFKTEPPVKINRKPDSIVIEYYMNLYRQSQ